MGAPQLQEKEAELLSQNLKILRQTMKWTQEDLAKRVGVTRQTITAIESGKMIPSKTLALAILALFASLAFLPKVGAVVKAILESSKLMDLLKIIIKGED
ncbi:helix-turn-helix domain-containing protein [Bacillus luteolus]|uniref:Helix-turn-helix domain-containing protein n=1 Tax=Litchfieldia luteola TaxID=682179 RepID=A0ABR9QI68_9BACI|nr:helix-turn-helix domain-containing protein [Cytobacillus luteolus]MBE4907874.1 helix-turn-helix domain-containing protein [Cytobacillus luteolus]MBP1943968.1 DNA-binding XRE family transcriptional regulator [Cytobacillus luteolus]